MYPPPSRGQLSTRKRKIPGPIAFLDNKSNNDLLDPSWTSKGLDDEEDESALEGVSQGADSAWWASGAWRSAWSVLGYPPLQERPSEAHAAAMCEEHIDTPLRALAANHWERERSGVFLAVIGAVHHHTDKDCTVQLVDPTGRAQAYLHCNVVADAGPELTTGAVVLIKKAALVHNRSEIGSWYLNVTPDNLMMLWPVTTRFVPPPSTNVLRRVNKIFCRDSILRRDSAGSVSRSGNEIDVGRATTPAVLREEGPSVSKAVRAVKSILPPKVSEPSTALNLQTQESAQELLEPSVQDFEGPRPIARSNFGITPTNSGNELHSSPPSPSLATSNGKDDQDDDGLLWNLTEDSLNPSPPPSAAPQTKPPDVHMAPVELPDSETAPIAAAPLITQARAAALPALPFQSNDDEDDGSLLDEFLDP